MKRLVRLRDRRHRDRERVFVVEGERLYRRALDAGLELEELFEAGERSQEPNSTSVAPEVLDQVSYRKVSEGLIAVFALPSEAQELSEIGGGPVLIAEGIEKPGNLGAMLRSALAAGATAVITTESVDKYNPNTLRSSTGAIFDLPVIESDWEAICAWAESSGIRLIAADGGAKRAVWDVELGGNVAIVIGSEADGLSEKALANASELVSIPMSSQGVDSLNASVAASILLYEVMRQNR